VSAADAASDDTDWQDCPLNEEVRHLLGNDHAFLYDELPRLSFLVERVTSRHGELYPELWELQGVFCVFREALEKHLEREENTLFPLLVRLEDGVPVPGGPRGLARLIVEMQQEHEVLTDALARMHCTTNGFESPNTACNTFRVLMESLRDIGVKLCRHLTEEETILFPRAMAMAGGLA
jgi:regulator of cell morphogenesis and NO signaling